VVVPPQLPAVLPLVAMVEQKKPRRRRRKKVRAASYEYSREDVRRGGILTNFGLYREGGIRRGHGLRSLRLSMSTDHSFPFLYLDAWLRGFLTFGRIAITSAILHGGAKRELAAGATIPGRPQCAVGAARLFLIEIHMTKGARNLL
jgi:hypothetical protein